MRGVKRLVLDEGEAMSEIGEKLEDLRTAVDVHSTRTAWFNNTSKRLIEELRRGIISADALDNYEESIIAMVVSSKEETQAIRELLTALEERGLID